MAYRPIPSTFTVAATNTPQPLFGSWVTAGAGFTQPALSPITITLGTALTSGNDAQMFKAGENAWLIDPNGAHAETVFVASKSGNTLILGNMTGASPLGVQNPVTGYPHVVGGIGVGTFILPKQMMNNFLVTFEDGGTGAFLYLGCQYNMTATAFRFFKMAKTTVGNNPYNYNSAMFSPGNPFDASELWAYGTAGDAWNLSVVID